MSSVPESIDALEEVLVRAHGLWWRSPGAGRWPFAGDGPWSLIQGEAGDYSGEGTDGVASASVPRPALDMAEVGERDRAALWLGMVPDAADRRLVHLATLALWWGEARVPWVELVRDLRSHLSADGLARRYRRVLAALVCAINGWPSRRARELVRGDGLVAEPAPARRVVVWDGVEVEVGASRAA